MKLPEFGVKRPVATGMLFLAIILIGLVSLKMLPIDLMPEMEVPSLTVITVYPGASANEVEEQVTKPLESVLSGAEHLKEIHSTSSENVSSIQLRYSWGSDVTSAANNARDLMEVVKSRLPEGIHAPIIYKINSSMMPILAFAVNANESYEALNTIMDEEIATPLRKVDGVGSVIYLGQPEREIHVSVSPSKLAAYHLSIAQISTILKADNVSVPSGSIKVGSYDFAVRMPGKFASVGEIENTVISAFGGKVVRLKDVADVTDSFVEMDAYARNELGKGVALLIQKQSGSNSLEVTKAVRQKLEEIKGNLPPDVQIHEIIGTDHLITESIDSLFSTIGYALVFVTLVVLLFLREWKSSLIIFLTMPVSLISAFATMYLLGYTINIFSLISLIIAVGMVVDNSIVVLENITQHIERGEKPTMAAIFGTSEMGMAIAASTATTLLVFLPLLFMGGLVGIMFKQLAILTCVCLIVSLFSALTLTPMLSSQLLRAVSRGEEQKKHSKLYRWSENVFVKIENAYKTVLGWAVFHKGLVVTISAVVFIGTLLLGKFVGTDYIPDFDAGTVTVTIETEVGSSAETTDMLANKLLFDIVDAVPEIMNGGIAALSGQTRDGALTTVGFKEGKNVATILFHLVPPDERKRSANEIGKVVQGIIEQYPEIESVEINAGSVLAAGLMGNKRPIEYIISGQDFDKLNATALMLQEKMEANGAFADVINTIDKGKYEVQIMVDKDKASQLALNAALIGMQIRQNLYGTEAGALSEAGNDYGILIRYSSDYRSEIDRLKEMRVTNLLGESIPLSAFATITQGQGPVKILHESQQRYVMTKAELNGVSLGEGHAAAKAILEECQGAIPDGVTVEIGGQVTDQESSFADLYLILFLGIMLVYMVMAAQFESFKDPFIILFAIPFTIVGVIWGFFITGTTLSVTTFIGLIILVGIVVNNGIVLVDYTNLLRKRNYNLRDAVLEAGRSRLRPVMMTTLTTVLGMLPMALTTGMGREMYVPLAITIIFGLLVSMLVTLILVPTIYTVLDQKTLLRDREKARREKALKQ